MKMSRIYARNKSYLMYSLKFKYFKDFTEYNAKHGKSVSLILSYLIISSLTAIKVNATVVGHDPL